MGTLTQFGSGFWLMMYSKTQDILHPIPISFPFKPWTIWPSCEHLHVCACMSWSLLPIDMSFPGALSLLAGLQVCPWRGSKVVQGGSCADMFSMKGEAGLGRSWCRGPQPPWAAPVLVIRGAERTVDPTPGSSRAAGHWLPKIVTKDGSWTKWLFLSI